MAIRNPRLPLLPGYGSNPLASILYLLKYKLYLLGTSYFDTVIKLLGAAKSYTVSAHDLFWWRYLLHLPLDIYRVTPFLRRDGNAEVIGAYCGSDQKCVPGCFCLWLTDWNLEISGNYTTLLLTFGGVSLLLSHSSIEPIKALRSADRRVS